MSEFMQRLSRYAPKAPEPKIGDPPMIAYQQHPIRQHAEVFARILEAVPADEREFSAALWVFGEMLCGDMEKRMNYALKLATDSVNYTPAPHVIIKEQP